jgi:hypothetical protein
MLRDLDKIAFDKKAHGLPELRLRFLDIQLRVLIVGHDAEQRLYPISLEESQESPKNAPNPWWVLCHPFERGSAPSS